MNLEKTLKHVKHIFEEEGGFTRSFGLKFKKFEHILSKEFSNKTGKELKYCVIRDVKETPLCEVDNCYNYAKFSVTKYKYSKGCCFRHIMAREGHKWSEESKDKLKQTQKERIKQKQLDDPDYLSKIGKKVSDAKLSYTEEEKKSINDKRKLTTLSKYGVENISQLKQIKDKKSKTFKNNYNVDNISQIESVQNNIRKTNESRGRWLKLEDIEDKKLYEYYVRKITAKQQLHTLENYDLRGPVEKDGYHLDHMYSISEGFRNNIPAYIVGNINNLHMIPAKENQSKNFRSSISLEELFLKIDLDKSSK